MAPAPIRALVRWWGLPFFKGRFSPLTVQLYLVEDTKDVIWWFGPPN